MRERKPTPPTPRPVNHDGIPATLRSLPRWIGWRYGNTPNAKGRFPKIPTSVYDGRVGIDPYDQSEWATFEQASRYVSECPGMGIGFVITPDLGVVVVDQDGCITDGNLTTLASDTVDRLDSFTQISDSERGLHTFVYGSIPSSVRKEIEIYHRHFFAMTGDRWPGTPATIQDRADAIADLHAEYADPVVEGGERQEAQPVDLADEPLLRRMFASRNGERLQRLWAGDWTGYPSQSEGDLALCGALAFWTGRDAERIDRLFRQSGLYRPQWEKQSYRNATIGQAIAGARDVFQGAPADPTVQFDGTVQDILKFARQQVAAHQFTGRGAEYGRQAALGAISILERAQSLYAPISVRTLAVASGMGKDRAQITLCGRLDRERKVRTVTPDTLILWLLELVDPSDGMAAGVYKLRGDLVEMYRDTAKVQTHSSNTACSNSVSVLSRCPTTTQPDLTPIVGANMTNDEFSRPSYQKRAPKPERPNVNALSHVDLLDRLCNLAGRITYHLSGEWLTTAELAERCTQQGDPVTTSDIAAAMTRIYALMRQIDHPPIFTERRGKITLIDDWHIVLADARPKLERLLMAETTLNQNTDDRLLKSFSPLGLAIVAYLDTLPDRTANIGELAASLDKHPATISAAVNRMSDRVATRKIGKITANEDDQPVAETLQPVLIVNRNPGRETLITLPVDWKVRAIATRSHLCTDGLNERRNVGYALERARRLRKMLDTMRNPEKIAEAERILSGAQSVVNWSQGKVLALHHELDRVDAMPDTPPQEETTDDPANIVADAPQEPVTEIAETPIQHELFTSLPERQNQRIDLFHDWQDPAEARQVTRS